MNDIIGKENRNIEMVNKRSIANRSQRAWMKEIFDELHGLEYQFVMGGFPLDDELWKVVSLIHEAKDLLKEQIEKRPEDAFYD